MQQLIAGHAFPDVAKNLKSNSVAMLIISPTLSNHSPVEMRTNAFATMWTAVEIVSPWAPATQKIKLAYRHGEVFLTMPPFRNFWVAALPGVRTIVDWRDGWSIAMASGYGGTRRRRLIKATISKLVELATIVTASEIWTCTPGLLEHHTKGLPTFLRRKIRIIPNGHQIEILPDRFTDVTFNKRVISAVCTGKFATYGESKARQVADVLAKRYPDSRVDIRVIGSPTENENALRQYINNKGYNITISWEARKSYFDLERDIASADLAIAVVRDQKYEFGTKIFDYVALGTPILDIFDDASFRKYFSGCFDTDYDPKTALKKAVSFHRRARVAAVINNNDIT